MGLNLKNASDGLVLSFSKDDEITHLLYFVNVVKMYLSFQFSNP